MLKSTQYPGAILVACLVGFAMGGCERMDSASQETGEYRDEPTAKLKAQDRDGEHGEGAQEALDPAPALSLASWPGRDGKHTFDLTWLGGTEPVVLHGAPALDAPVLATVAWRDGDGIDWHDTRHIVTVPRIFRAPEEFSFEASSYDVDEALALDEMIEVRVAKDDVVRVYGDAGEEQCYLGRGDAIYIASCTILRTGLRPVDLESDLKSESESLPGEESAAVVREDQEERARASWEPLESQWWVEIKTEDARGWWLVDEDRVEVRTRVMED